VAADKIPQHGTETKTFIVAGKKQVGKEIHVAHISRYEAPVLRGIERMRAGTAGDAWRGGPLVQNTCFVA
jgi:hypothetical protein